MKGGHSCKTIRELEKKETKSNNRAPVERHPLTVRGVKTAPGTCGNGKKRRPGKKNGKHSVLTRKEDEGRSREAKRQTRPGRIKEKGD